MLRRQREVGTGRHQHADGVDVAVGSVTQDDRLVQGGPAQPVDVVDAHPGPHQATADGRVAPVGCPDQSGAVVGVEGADIAAGIQGQLEQLQIALAGRDQVRALLRLVLGVDVRAGRDQPPGPFDVVGPRCVAQVGVQLRPTGRRGSHGVRARHVRASTRGDQDHDSDRETSHPSSVRPSAAAYTPSSRPGRGRMKTTQVTAKQTA